MYYVYILKSINYQQIYIGYTKNLKQRVEDHNCGRSGHTKKYKPWKIVYYSGFEKEHIARSFEEYLKTGSGIAFLRRHLI
jgi:predicted GIY-YIG superfamily endonuclease